ncbi:MAG TPA: ATP-binding cassette domain-containing protein [Anaeromyxobacteraceae bacterium]|nr:ATP-binding cassette domain-containing protein [Anaeromyxobacteraceae bacterium]
MTKALALRAAPVGSCTDRPVLNELCLEVSAGERVAILGGNGAGKTTLLKTAVGLLPVRSGELRIFGHLVRAPRDAVLAGAGLLFQNPSDQLFGATVLEDAAFGPVNQGMKQREAFDRARAALCQAGLSALADRSIEALSFGEQRRACLAGILAMEPRLLLLDEPTAGLDPAGELAAVSLLRSLAAAGATIVAATHAVDLVPLLADRVVLLGRGRVLADGPAREVFADEELLASAHVRAPTATRLWRALRQGRAELGRVPLTIEEVLEWNAPLS